MGSLISRKFAFDSAHRLIGHEGKCAHNHGHRYEGQVFVSPVDGLDDIGRVVDFQVLKEICGGWVDKHLDHGTILNSEDKEFVRFLTAQGNKLYTINTNPTAENIADHLRERFSQLLQEAGYNVNVDSVRIDETPNCIAWSEGEF